MLSARQFRESILVFLGVALAAGNASAQPVYHRIRTVEARVGQADQVIVGTIEKASRKTIVAPGGTDKIGVIWPEGRFEYTLTLKVSETLKGNLKGLVDDLRPQPTTFTDERYEQWERAETSMLWFLGPTPKRGQRRQWDFLPLGEPVPAERGFSSRRGPHFSKDFRPLKDNEEVLACARAYARTTPKVQPTHSIRVPAAIAGPWSYLIVPVEPTLEQRAIRLIAAPQEFVPRADHPHPYDLRMLRFSGGDALRYFKSDANADLLRSLLDEPPEAHEVKPVCVRAYEILLHWGVETPLPKSAQKINSLDLSCTDVTDQALKQVAELGNLMNLELQGTKVTHEGLRELAALKSLTWLDLRDTRVTDAGLKELAGLTNLDTLLLQGTQVTDAGVHELQKALPNCTIKRGPE